MQDRLKRGSFKLYAKGDSGKGYSVPLSRFRAMPIPTSQTEDLPSPGKKELTKQIIDLIRQRIREFDPHGTTVLFNEIEDEEIISTFQLYTRLTNLADAHELIKGLMEPLKKDFFAVERGSLDYLTYQLIYNHPSPTGLE